MEASFFPFSSRVRVGDGGDLLLFSTREKVGDGVEGEERRGRGGEGRRPAMASLGRGRRRA